MHDFFQNEPLARRIFDESFLSDLSKLTTLEMFTFVLHVYYTETHAKLCLRVYCNFSCSYQMKLIFSVSLNQVKVATLVGKLEQRSDVFANIKRGQVQISLKIEEGRDIPTGGKRRSESHYSG